MFCIRIFDSPPHILNPDNNRRRIFANEMFILQRIKISSFKFILLLFLKPGYNIFKIIYMIQRFQTVYLFLAALLGSSMLLMTIAEFNIKDTGRFFILDVFGLKEKTETIIAQPNLLDVYPLAILLLITVAISLITIFKYKNRVQQIKLGRLNIFLYAALVAGVFFYAEKAVAAIGETGEVITNYKIAAVFPVIALVLTFMANRAIKKDEDLVRSADRIR
jgi:hypothetical protein